MGKSGRLTWIISGAVRWSRTQLINRQWARFLAPCSTAKSQATRPFPIYELGSNTISSKNLFLPKIGDESPALFHCISRISPAKKIIELDLLFQTSTPSLNLCDSSGG
jgi:hypothetical protein